MKEVLVDFCIFLFIFTVISMLLVGFLYLSLTVPILALFLFSAIVLYGGYKFIDRL